MKYPDLYCPLIDKVERVASSLELTSDPMEMEE
jgi:hypothetical protein